LSVDLPAARRFCCQRRFIARPPSMHASDEPTVEHPGAPLGSGACQRSASIEMQRCSISAVCGYSSLLIMFLGRHSDMSRPTSGSIHVVTKVARFWRALPSSINSSWMIWYAAADDISPSGSRLAGIGAITEPWAKSGLTERCSAPRRRRWLEPNIRVSSLWRRARVACRSVRPPIPVNSSARPRRGAL
jgi:hypothetical protein